MVKIIIKIIVIKEEKLKVLPHFYWVTCGSHVPFGCRGPWARFLSCLFHLCGGGGATGRGRRGVAWRGTDSLTLYVPRAFSQT